MPGIEIPSSSPPSSSSSPSLPSSPRVSVVDIARHSIDSLRHLHPLLNKGVDGLHHLSTYVPPTVVSLVSTVSTPIVKTVDNHLTTALTKAQTARHDVTVRLSAFYLAATSSFLYVSSQGKREASEFVDNVKSRFISLGQKWTDGLTPLSLQFYEKAKGVLEHRKQQVVNGVLHTVKHMRERLGEEFESKLTTALSTLYDTKNALHPIVHSSIQSVLTKTQQTVDKFAPQQNQSEGTPKKEKAKEKEMSTLGANGNGLSHSISNGNGGEHSKGHDISFGNTYDEDD